MKEHWMQTYTGKVFQAYSPSPNQIDIVDIAHSLSMQCRYNGHIERFYSVAEHSVRCSLIVPEEKALEALLHDATEAYIGDLPSPVKRGLPTYRTLEQLIWEKAIAPKFGLPNKLSPEVKKADLEMLVLEKQFLISDYGHDWHLEGIKVPEHVKSLNPLTQAQAKQLFLDRYEELTSGQQNNDKSE